MKRDRKVLVIARVPAVLVLDVDADVDDNTAIVLELFRNKGFSDVKIESCEVIPEVIS